jgi:nucleotide-binding universal stress UspA family protein
MEALRRVTAATDFSPDALHAAHRAANICVDHRAELTLLHVLESNLLLAARDLLQTNRDLQAALASQVEIELGVLGSEITLQHIAVRSEVRQGTVVQQLLEAASSTDLLVLGARGRGLLRNVLLGSTAERLARTAPCPLLVVRKPLDERYRRVLVPVDFSHQSRQALLAAMRLAPDASFHLLHCYEVPFEGRLRLAGVTDADINRYRSTSRQAALDLFDEFRRELPPHQRVSTAVRNGDPRLELLEEAREQHCQLVALGKQGRFSLGDTLLGSTTSWTLAHAASDVLVVPAARDS